jgi:hypothetical protein
VGKPKEKRPLGKSRHRWDDNIKMDLKEYYGIACTKILRLRTGTISGCWEAAVSLRVSSTAGNLLIS